MCEEMDDVRHALQRAIQLASNGPPPAAASTAGEKLTVLSIGGATWVGEVASGRPHGHGDLILPTGSVHNGAFLEGRAEGAGVFYEANGSVHRGWWRENKRVGEFTTVDPKGATWADLYDEQGKRVSRRRQAPSDGGSSGVCRFCGVKFHVKWNSRCLQHSGKWIEAPTHNADGSAATVDRVAFPEGGLWLCCGSKSRHAAADGRRGCVFGVHEVAVPSPAASVPEERPRLAEGGAGAEAGAGGTSHGTSTVGGVIPSFIETSFPTRVEYNAWRAQMELGREQGVTIK